MSKAFITDYEKYCLLCGKPTTTKHHWLFGSDRRKADEDGIYASICDDEHTLNGRMAIHNNGTCEKMSRIIGQLFWEINFLNTKEDILKARKEFMKRYGKSYI